MVTHRVNDEWVYGTLGESKGMFPSSFIDSVPDNLPMRVEEEPVTAETSTSNNTTAASDEVCTCTWWMCLECVSCVLFSFCKTMYII